MADSLRSRDRSRAARKRGPVFVDSSGRSLGRVRILGGIALAAVTGYVVLLVVAVLGGPNVAAPYLLQPPVAAPEAAPTPTHAPVPSSPTSGAHSAVGAEAAPAVVAGPAVARPAVPAAAPTGQAPAVAPAEQAQAAPAPAEGAHAGAVDPGKSESAPGQQDTRPTAPAKP